jgi:hypothetical protein
MWKRLYVKYPSFLSDFNETWILATDFKKNLMYKNFIKILPVGAELFHADGRTDRYNEANSRDYASAPKILKNR